MSGQTTKPINTEEIKNQNMVQDSDFKNPY